MRATGVKFTGHSTLRNAGDGTAPGTTVSTGRVVSRSTRCVTEPSTARFNPRRPWVAMTIRSASISSAKAQIACAGCSSRNLVSIVRPFEAYRRAYCPRRSCNARFSSGTLSM